MVVFTFWCLLFVLIRQGLRGGSGPLRLIRAPGIETGNPIMTYEQRSIFFDCGRVLFGSRVAKREAEGTVHTKHQLNLDPNPEGT